MAEHGDAARGLQPDERPMSGTARPMDAVRLFDRRNRPLQPTQPQDCVLRPGMSSLEFSQSRCGAPEAVAPARSALRRVPESTWREAIRCHPDHRKQAAWRAAGMVGKVRLTPIDHHP